MIMNTFDRIVIFVWYFILAIFGYFSARNLDKCFNTDYIGDIAIIFLLTCVLVRVIVLEELNNKQDKK